MLNVTSLKSYLHKDLAQMAKQRGISGWHAMRKEQLIKALLKASKAGQSSSASKPRAKRPQAGVAGSNAATSKGNLGRSQVTSRGASSGSARQRAASGAGNGRERNAGRSTSGRKLRDAATLEKIQAVHHARDQMRDLSTVHSGGAGAAQRQRPAKDRIVLMVRDPYWLHACWELTDRSVERAQAALAEKWHAARPVIRLVRVERDGGGNRSAVGNSAEQIVRVVEIHGAVSNWYLAVQEPPCSFRVEIGYLASDGQFYSLARSNVVTTPRPGGSEMIDGHWADVIENPERIYAMSGGFDGSAGNGELQELFEERLRRPMGSPMVTRFGNGAEAILAAKSRSMNFKIDAEMIVFGMADPDAFVTMGGEPVRLAADGSFTARVSLPDKRQIIPIVASRGDGVEEQTIVLAVERNTKVMEPVVREPGS